MRAQFCRPVIAFLLAFASWATGSPAEQSRVESVAHQVPCSPVGTLWPASSSESSQLEEPQLSVVVTDLRPKDARVYLDGRFIGRARYFNGRRGLLFLQPGSYRLEIQSNGFRTDVFKIDAAPTCRFSIKHRMTRQHGTKKLRRDGAGKGIPVQRVFGPLRSTPLGESPQRRGRADPSLRPDLTGKGAAEATSGAFGASLKLSVRPETASIFLDGVFVATGEELASMVGPLAIPTGSHQLKVEAPGYSPRTVSFEITAGETLERDVVLQRLRE